MDSLGALAIPGRNELNSFNSTLFPLKRVFTCLIISSYGILWSKDQTFQIHTLPYHRQVAIGRSVWLLQTHFHIDSPTILKSLLREDYLPYKDDAWGNVFIRRRCSPSIFVHWVWMDVYWEFYESVSVPTPFQIWGICGINGIGENKEQVSNKIPLHNAAAGVHLLGLLVEHLRFWKWRKK